MKNIWLLTFERKILLGINSRQFEKHNQSKTKMLLFLPMEKKQVENSQLFVSIINFIRFWTPFSPIKIPHMKVDHEQTLIWQIITRSLKITTPNKNLIFELNLFIAIVFIKSFISKPFLIILATLNFYQIPFVNYDFSLYSN